MNCCCAPLIKAVLDSIQNDLIICIENQVIGENFHLGNKCVYSSYALLKLLKLTHNATLFGEVNHDGLCDGICRIKNADGKCIFFNN